MDIKFKNIIDIPQLQSMLDHLFKATGLPISIVDVDGNVLIRTGWQDICLKFHRAHPETNRLCQESDSYVKELSFEEKSVRYKCKNGMWHIVIPIMIKEEHLATVFLSQFFYNDEVPDEDFFREHGEKFGFNIQEYLNALRKVRFFSRNQVKNIIDFYYEFAQHLADIGYTNLLLSRNIKELHGMLPICSHCKKIRDDKGYWNKIESYIESHSDAEFTHGICPECAKKYYPEFNLYDED